MIFAAAAFIVGATAAYLIVSLTGRTSSPPAVTQVSGKALIGGPFTLTDHTGKAVTEKDFAGRYMLVYFGFTFCPDVCPTELQIMTSALEQLGTKADKVTPVFISVDPKRDTVEQMASYVGNFHKRLVGLTGTPEQIKAAAKAYRVYYAEVKDESSSAGYTVDHSSIVFLMGPDGGYLAHFSHGTSPEKMAETIAGHL
jgi:protein SCO1/2